MDEDYEDMFFLDKDKDNDETVGIKIDDDDDEPVCDLDILVKPPIHRDALKPKPEVVSPYYSFTRKKGKRAVNWNSK